MTTQHISQTCVCFRRLRCCMNSVLGAKVRSDFWLKEWTDPVDIPRVERDHVAGRICGRGWSRHRKPSAFRSRRGDRGFDHLDLSCVSIVVQGTPSFSAAGIFDRHSPVELLYLDSVAKARASHPSTPDLEPVSATPMLELDDS